MISMEGISRLENAIQKTVESFQSSPEFARLVDKNPGAVVKVLAHEEPQRLGAVVSTLEIFIEAYSRPNDDDPVRSMSSLLCALATVKQELRRIVEDMARPDYDAL